MNRKSATQSRLVLIGLILTFIGPLILATLMYYSLDAWEQPERSNYGELLLPFEQLQTFDATGEQGEPVALDRLHGVWTLVYVATGECDIYCETSLFTLRQVRAMLGRDLTRLQYFYLATDKAALASAQRFKQGHPAMQIFSLNESAANGMMEAFGDKSERYSFLIDPHGNLVLRYPQGARTKGIYKDVHKLLENSRIG